MTAAAMQKARIIFVNPWEQVLLVGVGAEQCRWPKESRACGTGLEKIRARALTRRSCPNAPFWVLLSCPTCFSRALIHVSRALIRKPRALLSGQRAPGDLREAPGQRSRFHDQADAVPVIVHPAACLCVTLARLLERAGVGVRLHPAR